LQHDDFKRHEVYEIKEIDQRSKKYRYNAPPFQAASEILLLCRAKQRRNITRHQQQRQRQQHQPRKNTNTALRLFPSRSSERIPSLSALPSMPITVFSSPKPVNRSTKTQALRV
jgi:hypothetical protein